ncbi:hypothetical protein [Vreelandella massiliensis]|uniref:hypothetical protein n=1 Tax=Vreelandella massiliensis TaxID=1816686 RepID=UPI00096A9D57|nr:hypothetical protein [Halomonas massiliensis]
MPIDYDTFMYYALKVDPKTLDAEGNHNIGLKEGRKQRVIHGRPAGEYSDTASDGNNVTLALYRETNGALVVQVTGEMRGFWSGDWPSKPFCLDFKTLDDLLAWLANDAKQKRLCKGQQVCLRRAKAQLWQRLSKADCVTENARYVTSES